MGTATTRLRRVGVGGVAAAVALGALATANTAFAAAGDFTAASAPNVTQGAASQKAGNLTAEFANTFTTNATETFRIGTYTCDTQANIDKAISFAAAPTVSLTGPFAGSSDGDKSSTKPTYTVALSSSSDACATVGVKDLVTVTLTKPAVGVGTDTFKLALSNITYNVGKAAATGSVTVNADGLTGVKTAVNAKVVNTSYTFIPVIAAQKGSSGNALGTATFTESTAGAYFPAGDSDVTLVLSGGTFTAGVTPKVSVPTGYTVKAAPATDSPASDTYTFTVTAPATPTKATVSISGLKFNAPGTAGTVEVEATVGTTAAESLPAVNVLDYAARSGGADRYSTAAALFNAEFAGEVSEVVLASGVDFPDALSANYLASRLDNGNGTGTLLTTPNSLPSVTRQAILSSGVGTVYILGGTGAVSASVANEIAALHVGNSMWAPFISVVRLGGADRYATNKVANERNFTSADTVLLASGAGFADALTLGPVAYANKYPLILTGGAKLGASELSQLSDFGPTNVVIAGGTGVVSQGIEDALRASGYNVLRLAGADRTLTAAQVATWASVGVGGATTGLSAGPDTALESNTVYVTNGLSFADALSAGPVAGAANSVIVATAGVNSLGQGIPSYLVTKSVGSAGDGTTVDTLHALGLTGAVSSSVMKAAAASIGQ